MSKRNRKGRVEGAEESRFPPKNPAEDMTMPTPHLEEMDIAEGQERLIDDEAISEHRPMNPDASEESPNPAEETEAPPERLPKEEL
jgi:hypothetical protein